jgi:hypothetical protein
MRCRKPRLTRNRSKAKDKRLDAMQIYATLFPFYFDIEDNYDTFSSFFLVAQKKPGEGEKFTSSCGINKAIFIWRFL